MPGSIRQSHILGTSGKFQNPLLCTNVSSSTETVIILDVSLYSQLQFVLRICVDGIIFQASSQSR